MEELIDKVDLYENIKYVIIFGSATEDRCIFYSDVDVLLYGDTSRKFIPPDNDEIYDILHAESILKGASIWSEIRRDGVLVYEKEYS